jgi:CRP-like cAMP-binding protein
MLAKQIHTPVSAQTQCGECPIRQHALFQGVESGHLEWTQQYRANQLQLAAKKVIYQEGLNSEYAYTLYSGWVALYKSLANGKRQITRFALPGDFLGFQPNLIGPCLQSAQSLTPVVLCAFPRKRLLMMMKERPELATNMSIMTARDMALCQQHLLGTGRKSAKERVAFLLLELYHRACAIKKLLPPQENDWIDFPIAQEDIADAVGLTTVHVNRTMQDLRHEGFIEYATKRLRIPNIEALATLAEFNVEDLVLSHPLL